MILSGLLVAFQVSLALDGPTVLNATVEWILLAQHRAAGVSRLTPALMKQVCCRLSGWPG